MRWVLRGAALVALFSLLVEFGFALPPGVRRMLHGIDLAVVGLFVLDQAVRLGVSRDRRGHLREHWLALSLTALLAVYLLVTPLVAAGAVLGRVALVGAQAYLLLRMFLDFANANDRVSLKARPEWVLAVSFLLVIAAGTLLLMMPRSRGAHAAPWSFVDALFTSTSAACVTGLSVRDTGSDLSFRGQAVVLSLIQIGGLGLVTVAMFVSFVRRGSFQVRQMTLIRDVLSIPSMAGLGRFLGMMLAITLLAELAGAAILFHARDDLALGPRAWWAGFHAVSAFCNAGFGLDATNLMPYTRSPQILLTVAGLITLGGLGFPVILNLLSFRLSSLSFVRRRQRATEAPSRLSVHTRLVLIMSAVLVVGGAALFWMAEADGVLAPMTGAERLMASLFQSVTTRTAGFNSVDMGALKLPTLLLMIVLMAVGASPVSTGGGIKTTAAAVLLLTVRSMMRNRESVDVFGRSIPRRFVSASVAIVALYGTGVLLVTTLLLVTQRTFDFQQCLFEAVSALSTVGLTTGITSKLDAAGKLILVGAMFAGRVGPLAILWTFLSRPPGLQYEYPEEPLVVT